MTEQERQARAIRAKQFLDDAIYSEAIEAVEKESYEALLKAKDDQTRREYIDRINVIRELRARIAAWVADGRVRQQPGIA